MAVFSKLSWTTWGFGGGVVVLSGALLFQYRKYLFSSSESSVLPPRYEAIGVSAIPLASAAPADERKAASEDEKIAGKADEKMASEGEDEDEENGGSGVSNRKPALSMEFAYKLWNMLKIAVPGLWTRQVLFLVLLAAALFTRTMLSMRLADIHGGIVKGVVERNWPQFLRNLSYLAFMALPGSAVNAVLRYLSSMLALSLREALVSHYHRLYLQPMMYYRLLNIDSRVRNPDQMMTETIDRWCKAMADLYTNLTKPVLDIFMFSRRIMRVMGPMAPLYVISYYILSGLVIRLISPSFGRMTAEAQRLEGKLRGSHARIIRSAEEIAFYGGHDYERSLIDGVFKNIISHMSVLYFKNMLMSVFDNIFIRYGAVLLGYGVLAMPVFGPRSSEYAAKVGDDIGMITRDYVRNATLLISLARAIGRIVISHRDLQKMAGFTSLVSELSTVMADVQACKYSCHMLVKSERGERDPNMRPGHGLVVSDTDFIEFDKVPIVTPNGDLLAHDVTFTVQRAQNLVIVGPNGCGKSSLFRVLGELWPLWGGTIKKPATGKLFYIPQKPYMVAGTLRDQMLYPDTREDMARKHVSDEQLLALLDAVKLLYLVTSRTAGLDSVEDWSEVLSGGEKQRVAMARLFYHKPLFAILDECTSAVSLDVEKLLYEKARKEGLSLITISHRESLRKYHEFELKFDGSGGVTFRRLPEAAP